MVARRESSGNAEAIMSDQEDVDLDGYLSPAEDTFSIFSDEHSGPKPYAQVRVFFYYPVPKPYSWTTLDASWCRF
jgi:hypothetical protein